jgi:predicted dehydrogenase
MGKNVNDGKLGVAIVGPGAVATAHAASWLKNPGVEIVSVTGRQKETAAKFAAQLGLACPVGDDFNGVLRDPRVDIVDICSPSHVHAPQAVAAAEAGKHLLVEKPMALSMEENRAVRDAVARAGVKSNVGFVLRWHPQTRILQSLLRSGAIGELFYAGVDYWHGIGPAHHAWQVYRATATSGSAMLLGGCHAVDLLRYLVDDEVVEVSAMSNNQKGLFEYDANVVALCKFRQGIVAKTSVLFDCTMPYTFNIDFAGTEGTLRDNRLWSQRLLAGQSGWATVPTTMIDSADVHRHPFDDEVNDLVEAIRSGGKTNCSVADAYRSHELCLAIDRSFAAGGSLVKLPLAD